MAACQFAATEAHKDEHKNFARMLSDKIRDLDEAQDETVVLRIGKELLTYLKGWLRNHILVIDMAYRPHVENNPEARKAAQRFKAAHVWWQR